MKKRRCWLVKGGIIDDWIFSATVLSFGSRWERSAGLPSCGCLKISSTLCWYAWILILKLLQKTMFCTHLGFDNVRFQFYELCHLSFTLCSRTKVYIRNYHSWELNAPQWMMFACKCSLQLFMRYTHLWLPSLSSLFFCILLSLFLFVVALDSFI